MTNPAGSAAPKWLRDILTWPTIHDVEAVTLTYHRWLPGDETPNLPLPLRYARPQPMSAVAAIALSTYVDTVLWQGTA